jgi:hypothetical protein
MIVDYHLCNAEFDAELINRLLTTLGGRVKQLQWQKVKKMQK